MTMEWIASHCSTWAFAQGGVFASLLLAGVLGSLTHCSTMCGPMVVSQMLNPAYGAAVSPQMQLLAYQAGRLTTYTILGMVAGLAGNWLFGSAIFPSFVFAALFIAGLLFLHSALWPSPRKTCECDATKSLFQLLHQMKAQVFLKAYLRGVLLGFMPCGLVIAALLLTATAGTPLLSALGMLIFGIGTVPLLHVIGIGAYRLFPRDRHFTHYIGKSAMTINGLFLCGLGIAQLQ